jgi:hypothetical protein
MQWVGRMNGIDELGKYEGKLVFLIFLNFRDVYVKTTKNVG